MNQQTRWVRLAGAANVRDLGGLPTDDGEITASGRVLRADNLQDLSPQDVRHLVDELQVRTVIDLRTMAEVEREGPGPLVREHFVVHRHCSLFPEGGRMTDVDADVLLPWQSDREPAEQSDQWAGDTDNPSIGYYLGYLRDRPDSVVAALKALAEPDGGGCAIVHCAAGKDRTGVVAALALAAAGVVREAIVADYVATGEVLDAILARLRSSGTYAPDIDESAPDVHRPRAATMHRFLQILDEQFGGPLGWLDQAGFRPKDVTRLRRRLRA